MHLLLRKILDSTQPLSPPPTPRLMSLTFKSFCDVQNHFHFKGILQMIGYKGKSISAHYFILNSLSLYL